MTTLKLANLLIIRSKLDAKFNFLPLLILLNIQSKTPINRSISISDSNTLQINIASAISKYKSSLGTSVLLNTRQHIALVQIILMVKLLLC